MKNLKDQYSGTSANVLKWTLSAMLVIIEQKKELVRSLMQMTMTKKPRVVLQMIKLLNAMSTVITQFLKDTERFLEIYVLEVLTLIQLHTHAAMEVSSLDSFQ